MGMARLLLCRRGLRAAWHGLCASLAARGHWAQRAGPSGGWPGNASHPNRSRRTRGAAGGDDRPIQRLRPVASHDQPQRDAGARAKVAIRRVRLLGGGTIVEWLEHTSDAGRVYLRSVVESPLPVDQCVAEIRVKDGGDGPSTVEWSSNFVLSGAPEREASRALREVYAARLQNVKRIYESLGAGSGARRSG